MIPFTGRLVFTRKQYMPVKASTYGVKLFRFCDSKGYAHYINVYGGKMTKAAAGEDGRASDDVVVRPMMNDYVGESRNILNNLDLAHYLLQKKTHLVGT
jgi:hypothetical protein